MRAPRSRGRQRMVPLRSAGRTAYRGREPPQRCQPRHGHPPRGSDNSARVATIFIYNGAPPALVGCLDERHARMTARFPHVKEHHPPKDAIMSAADGFHPGRRWSLWDMPTIKALEFFELGSDASK